MMPKNEDENEPELPEVESPLISFMWLDEMHNEVPEEKAIYGFGIRADGTRFAMGPRTKKASAVSNIENQIAAREVTVKEKQTLIAPIWMRENAKRGLEWHKEGKSGKGITPKTLAEARAIVSGKVSINKAMRMAAWFARHMSDLSAPAAKVGANGYPSPGVVAHALWGGGTRPKSRRAESWANAHSPDE